jgi:general nucleoside transport system ATP-binding protein
LSPTVSDTASQRRAIGLEVIGMRKTFGPLVALDGVSLDVPAGSFHALLGENGAGKSTLVKCITGFYRPESGKLLVDGAEVSIPNPRRAHAAGIGLVHQNFVLVPSLTGAENLVISRNDVPQVINWRAERARLSAFLDRMPFRAPLDRPVHRLAAGEKQKLEILRQLYLDQRCLILDEPTSVMTPDEADVVLGLLRAMAARGEITIVMISHKFREVRAFADAVTVLRNGRLAGAGKVADLSNDQMARMMIGDVPLPPASKRRVHAENRLVFEVEDVSVENDEGGLAVEGVSLSLRSGEIVGIAGVAGNGQTALFDVLTGQRAIRAGRLMAHGGEYRPNRKSMARHRVFSLPEEPLKNAAAPKMSVGQNMAFRNFDRPPLSTATGWLSLSEMRRQARRLVAAYRVRTPSTETPIENLSGGNVQRTVLARELSGDVGILFVTNPCAGLDFASVEDIRSQIMGQRNRGAAVLLISEDLDEILELADWIAVMSMGRVTYMARIGETDRATIGRHMAGHSQ